MCMSAHRARPFSYREVFRATPYALAITTELRRRKEPIDYNDLLAVPLSFVFELSAELAPTRVLYGLGELMVFYHILWR